MIDIADVNKRFFGVLKSASAGVDIRAALGAGADSVLAAHALNRATLPARMAVALRGGPINSIDLTAQSFSFGWYVYDDPEQGFRRINTLIPAIVGVYVYDGSAVIQVTTGGAIGLIRLSQVGPEYEDPALGLNCRLVQFSVTAI